MKIIQEKISPKHNDSLFYDGEIASIGKYLLIACGDIEIYKENEGRVFARGKHYSDIIDFDNDNDLYKEMENKDNKLSWEYNNWFELIDSESDESILGDVAHGYDEGIELLKQYHREKIYDQNN